MKLTIDFFRNSVVAGWFLMEFHIAHEKVIWQRKKYLIPLMMEAIKSNDIRDADLRMYIESHTYQDCTDLVSRTSQGPRVKLAFVQKMGEH